MNNIKRIIYNTGILYVKLFVSLVLGLFTTRFVLQALGETNYGIYTLVAGIVGMLAILQSAMSNTSMRYMAHSLGTGNIQSINKTFNTTLKLHLFIGLLVVLFIELGGYFMFKYAINIPADKLWQARIVFHFMVITSFVAIIAVPYDAVINAHENLLALSLVDILGTVLNLGVALLLLYLVDSYALIWYGFSVLCIQVLKRVLKQIYAIRHYPEVKLNLKLERDEGLTKQIVMFSGWNLLGSIAAMSVTQMRSILLNVFFGVRINASEGVAKTISGQINMLSTNLSRAINPQLIRSEGGGDRERMIRLTIISTKFTTFLFIFIVIPAFIELPYLFNLWLKDVPEYAILFARVILIGMFIEKLTFGITDALRAVGEIKQFQLTETIIVLLNIPITYILFRNEFPPVTIYIVSVGIALLCAGFRLYFGRKFAEIEVIRFVKQAILPTLLPIVVSGFICYVLQTVLSESIVRVVILSVVSVITSLFIIYKFSLNASEKNIITGFISKIPLWKKK